MRTDSHWTKALCLCLSVTLIVPPAALAAALPGEPAAAEVAAQLEQFATDYENACRLIEELLPQIPRDTFDMKVIVEQARSEPTRIFKWVRDNTYLVPYRGLLRSGHGVLMDRLGNGPDRAMLLYELLGLAGQEVRLARGTLSDEQLKTLVEGRRKIPPEGSLPRSKETSRDDVTTLIAELARKHGLDVAQLSKAAQEQTRKAEELREQARQRVASQTDALLSLLGDLPEKASAAELARPQGEAYRDHWWVQWNKGGRWIDLDPTLPNAKPAQTLSDAEKTLLPEAIEDEIKHRVEIRVVTEIWDRGQLREATLLSHMLQPSELMGKRVVLTHYPVGWPENFTPFSEGATSGRFRATLLEQRDWMPLLRIDNQATHQNSITVDGIVDETPPLGPAAAAGEGISSKLGGFGAVLDAIGEPPEPTETEEPSTGKVLTAAWIEYVLLVPGQETKEIRRQIFDLIGPAVRASRKAVPEPTITENLRLQRAMALLMETDIVVLSSQSSENFILHSFAESILANRTKVQRILEKASSAELHNLLPQLAELTRPQSAPHWLALARNTWRHDKGSSYSDRAVVFSRHTGARFNEQSKIFSFDAFDIVSNPVAVPPEGILNSFRERLEQGVLDTNAESLLLRPGTNVGENVAKVFEDSLEHQVPWVLLESPDDPRMKKIALPVNVAARVYADLSAGYLVVVPKAQLPEVGESGFGWWRIDPINGDTLGISSQGWGGNLVEYSIVVSYPLAFSGSWASCMGHHKNYSSASGMKAVGCAICATVSAHAVLLALVPPVAVATAIGVAAGIGGAGCGFFGAYM